MALRRRRSRSAIVPMIPNPEYLRSREFEMDKDEAKTVLLQRSDCLEDYFPEDYGKKLPDEGGWILMLANVDVAKELNDGKLERIHVPHLSIWYAMPHATSYSVEVGPVEMSAMQAIIQTPQGQVHIWPHEYNVVSDISKWLQFTEEEGFFVHFLDPQSAGFDEQKLHYIRSRGISLAQARRWLLPEIKSPFCCYFTLAKEYAEVFPEWTGSATLAGRRRKLCQTY